MKRSIERARQKAALEAVESYEQRIAELEKQVKKLNSAVGKLLKASKAPAPEGGPDG